MHKARALSYGLLVLLAGAAGASAQLAGGVNFQELFQQLDSNGDTVIDRGEVPESGRAAFETLLKNGDKDKNGKLDREEYREMFQSLRGGFGSLSSRFAEVDKNADGKIGKDEFQGPAFAFERIDADGDGFITKDEAGKMQGGPAAGPAGKASMFAQRLKSMDQNGDGKISKDEFSGPRQVFESLDANSDGLISPEEMSRIGAGSAQKKGQAKAKAKAKAAP